MIQHLLLRFIAFQETLTARVTAVKFSDRLLSSPAVVSGFLSSTLRRMMKATLQGAPESQLSEWKAGLRQLLVSFVFRETRNIRGGSSIDF